MKRAVFIKTAFSWRRVAGRKNKVEEDKFYTKHNVHVDKDVVDEYDKYYYYHQHNFFNNNDDDDVESYAADDDHAAVIVVAADDDENYDDNDDDDDADYHT